MSTIIHRETSPFHAKTDWERQETWNAAWVHCPAATTPPLVTAYRLRFSLDHDQTARLHVTADERYELYLDGERIGRGSERGNIEHWFYETYELRLTAGKHVLAARVWSLGDYAPLAQFSVRPGFLLAAESGLGDVLNTGIAPWEALLMDGYTIQPPVYVWGLSAPITVDGQAFPWGWQRGEGDGWQPVMVDEKAASVIQQFGIAPLRYLRHGTLPQMMERKFSGGKVRHVAATGGDWVKTPVRVADHLSAEEAGWQGVWDGTSGLTIPARTNRRVIIDLETYLCAYPELIVSGGRGSRITMNWTESLRLRPEMWDFRQGNRDEIEGKYFFGMGNTFLPDGGEHRLFDILWWAAGRYVEIIVQTADEPLRLEAMTLLETRYPLEMESRFVASDPHLVALQPMMARGWQMCAHETYMDCPYYEQMQYAADARLEALVTFTLTRDDRLPRKMLYLFDASRHANGLTEARYPVRQPQFIPWFAMLFPAMVHDYACWRDDPSFVRSLLPGVRTTLEAFIHLIGEDGLVRTPEGWNDTESFSEPGISGLLNWQMAYALTLAAELEEDYGEVELANRDRRLARLVAKHADVAFWDQGRGVYADDLELSAFSETVQCFALLSGLTPPEKQPRLLAALAAGKVLKRTALQSTHYLFEVCRQFGLADVFFQRLAPWHEMLAKGLKTPIEDYEPNRSDCHAWNSHPLFHYFATILGIRPAASGFRRVEIRPMLGSLAQAGGRLVHPGGGEIIFEVQQKADGLHGLVELPPGVTGRLILPDRDLILTTGRKDF